MATTDLLLGLDAGSSVCKAALFDGAGRLVAMAAEPTPLLRTGGRVEADPVRAWAAAAAVLRRMAEAAQGRGRIVGLGLSGAMVGAWVIDAAGQTLRPGINWEDSRAGHLIDRLRAANPQVLSDIFARSGSALQQGCTLPVLAALLEEEPALMARAAAVLTYKDWLRLRLTGVMATDASEAAVSPGDARAQSRSPALIDLFGLTGQAHLLPPVLPSAAIAGHVTAAAAAETGLPEGLPVVAGAGDVIANVIGAGGLQPGAIIGLLGTTCMIGLCRREPVFTPPDLGLLFSLPEGHWFRAMVNVAGTLNLDWAVSLLCPDLAGRADLWDRVTEMAARVPVGARGVTYLPYLSESGIIAPVADPSARAGFGGLTPAVGRDEMIRAVYEGVALSIADLCDLLAPPEGGPIVLTGGGGRSALWCQMIAEATGRTVIVPAGEEFGARGAALLAATALGMFGSVAEASRAMAGEGQSYRPTGEEADAWAAARAAYHRARDRALNQHL
jgi:sugar (pentulose or hexulose) kinase